MVGRKVAEDRRNPRGGSASGEVAEIWLRQRRVTSLTHSRADRTIECMQPGGGRLLEV